MAGSDPLGRRALFWLTPSEEQSKGDKVKPTKRSDRAIDEGRRAFYSKTAIRQDGGTDGSTRGARSRARRNISGRYASEHSGSDDSFRLVDADVVAGDKANRRSKNDINSRNGSKVKSVGRTGNGSKAENCPYGVFCVDITCGSCKKTTTVTIQEFLMMHWPIWVWLPGRGNTHLLTCPMCRKRTWLSVSWPSSSRG
ncbi:MAG: hypothetical protein M1456_01140 [Actinobacteria bacterium]|nr:hypothetical protein [Actinomycetota bacterium]